MIAQNSITHSLRRFRSMEARWKQVSTQRAPRTQRGTGAMVQVRTLSRAWFLKRARNRLYLENRGPLFAGDEQAFMLRIVSDAIQNRFGIDHLIGGKQACEVDPADHVPVLRRDAHDHIRVPDVGVNLAFDEFQLIETIDANIVFLDHDVARFLERVGIAESQRGAAVAGNYFLRGAGHAPAFTRIGKLLDRLQRGAIEDETDVGLPSPLIDVRSPVDDSLSEILRWKIVTLEGLTGFRITGHNGGASFDAGSLIELSIEVEEPFCITIRRVRIFCDYLVTIDGSGGGRIRTEQKGKRGEDSREISKIGDGRVHS